MLRFQAAVIFAVVALLGLSGVGARTRRVGFQTCRTVWRVWNPILRGWVFTLAVAVALLGLSAGWARAQTLYGITGPGDQLITINLATGAGTLVGPLSSTMTAPGLAFRGNKLYAWDTVASRLRELDPVTAATLNTIDLGIIAAPSGDLTFRSDGIGFLTNPNTKLWSFDITVPSSTLVTGALNPGMAGLAFSPGGVLFGLIAGGTVLHTIDPATGVTTLVGNTGIPFGGTTGLAFDASGNLFAAAGAKLYQLNVVTGAATLIGNIGFANVSGIAFMPAPAAFGGGSSGSTGNGEGTYAGCRGPHGNEGGMGFGASELRPANAPAVSTRGPILHGPLPDLSGNRTLLVFNVSHRQIPSADPGAGGGIAPLAWTLLAGLAFGLTAFLVVKYRPA